MPLTRHTLNHRARFGSILPPIALPQTYAARVPYIKRRPFVTRLSPPATTMLQPISQFPSRQVHWLWPNRLPLGKLAILDGDPGLGKSLIALDLCARLSTGREFPDGSPGPTAAASIILNG